jgi:hypothetical protein
LQSALWKLRDRIDGLPAAPTFPRGRGVMHALLAAEREKVVNKNRLSNAAAPPCQLCAQARFWFS